MILTMNKYTIYCTPEQTRKALELGAPIRFASINDIRLGRYIEVESNNEAYEIPTTEQMIGWLDEQGIAIDIHTYFRVGHGKIHHYQYTVTDLNRVFNGEYTSRKETTLAAIDAALEYLTKAKVNYKNI